MPQTSVPYTSVLYTSVSITPTSHTHTHQCHSQCYGLMHIISAQMSAMHIKAFMPVPEMSVILTNTIHISVKMHNLCHTNQLDTHQSVTSTCSACYMYIMHSLCCPVLWAQISSTHISLSHLHVAHVICHLLSSFVGTNQLDTHQSVTYAARAV